MIPTPELQLRIAKLRERARSGEMTEDEAREAVAFLREQRTMALSNASAAGRKTDRTKPAAPNVDAMFDELDKL